MPERGRLFKSWLGGKAKALADAVGGLNQNCPSLRHGYRDICCGDTAERRRVLPKKDRPTGQRDCLACRPRGNRG